MKLVRNDRPALLLVDIQKGFDNLEYWGGHRNNPYAEERASQLLEHWRLLNLPIFHIQHCSTIPTSMLHPSNPGNEIKDIVKPLEHETVIWKNVNSAFIGTNLRERLDDDNITRLVVVGMTTDHCISTTVRMAGNFGYDTLLVSDATATFDRISPHGQLFPASLIHETALTSLHGEFATVVTTNDVVKSLHGLKATR
ncbi:MAG: cysteine hydrolase family protein [Cyclobacteriaceae bacterium]|jgi:nicotinamidase-related amidase|nr:cysteine hydrolase family protein [Cyclobacteriaceae bacterium]